jgi:hypothetical protein
LTYIQYLEDQTTQNNSLRLQLVFLANKGFLIPKMVFKYLNVLYIWNVYSADLYQLQALMNIYI